MSSYRNKFLFSMLISFIYYSTAQRQNTVKCKKGFYLNSTSNICNECKICQIGYGVSQPCMELSNTICEPCKKGFTYSSTTSMFETCRPCSTCKTPTIQTEKCNRRRDTQCKACETGYFLSAIVNTCEKCSYCFPDVKGLTFRINACNQPGIPEDFQCIYVYDPPYVPPETPEYNRINETNVNTIKLLNILKNNTNDNNEDYTYDDDDDDEDDNYYDDQIEYKEDFNNEYDDYYDYQELTRSNLTDAYRKVNNMKREINSMKKTLYIQNIILISAILLFLLTLIVYHILIRRSSLDGKHIMKKLFENAPLLNNINNNNDKNAVKVDNV